MSAVPLSQAVTEYLAARAARQSPATVKNESHVLTRFAATVAKGREIQMRNLTAEHVESWFVILLQPHTDRSGVSRPPIQATTWNNYFARIKSFAAYCARRGWTRADLLAYVHPLKVTSKVRQQPSVDPLLAMLKNTTEPRDRAVLACAMNTGMRAGEIAMLRVGKVDLDTLTLRVNVSKSKIEDDMPITSDLASELHIWLAAYAKSIERPLLPTDLLLPARTGPRYRWRTLPNGAKEKYQIASTYVPHRPVTKLHRIAQAGLRSVGLATRHEGIHTVRRAVARAYYDSLAVDPKRGHDEAIRVVMTLLHHTNVSTTEHYLGVSGERRARDESLRGRSFLVPSTNQIAARLSTPAGEFLASVMASAAQWERRIIGQRTREAMAAKKAAGVRLGPPRRLPDHVAERIIDLRSSGLSWARVAGTLNESEVPTALAGRQWYPSTARNAALAYERDMVRTTGSSER